MSTAPVPYYSDDLVTLYHGDAREWMPVADVIVTDPPYGVAFEGKATKHTIRKGGGYTTADDADVGPVVVSVALQTVKRGAVFSGNRGLHDYPKPRDNRVRLLPEWCWHRTVGLRPLPSGPVLRAAVIEHVATDVDAVL